MRVTLLDTKTGKRRDCTSWCDSDFSIFWWSHGNGSCDCNRALAFDIGDEDHSEDQRIALDLDENRCLGAERWLIVDVSGDLEGWSRDDVLLEANSDYPEELVARHIIKRLNDKGTCENERLL